MIEVADSELQALLGNQHHGANDMKKQLWLQYNESIV